MSETEYVMYYDYRVDEERKIATDKVMSASRVIREMSELESDSDHVNSALISWKDLMLELYDGPFWPDDQEVTSNDIENALELAEIFEMENLEYDITVAYLETEPEGVHYLADEE